MAITPPITQAHSTWAGVNDDMNPVDVSTPTPIMFATTRPTPDHMPRDGFSWVTAASYLLARRQGEVRFGDDTPALRRLRGVRAAPLHPARAGRRSGRLHARG